MAVMGAFCPVAHPGPARTCPPQAPSVSPGRKPGNSRRASAGAGRRPHALQLILTVRRNSRRLTLRWWSKERRPASCGEMQVQGLPSAHSRGPSPPPGKGLVTFPACPGELPRGSHPQTTHNSDRKTRGTVIHQVRQAETHPTLGGIDAAPDPGHQATRPPGHQVTRSPGHQHDRRYRPGPHHQHTSTPGTGHRAPGQVKPPRCPAAGPSLQ